MVDVLTKPRIAAARLEAPTIDMDPTLQPRAVYPGGSLPTFLVARIARQCVAQVMDCDPLLLMGKARGPRRLAAARVIAIHLVHIVAGRSHEDVARAFTRNRSTASHHFERVEDLRDVAAFDGFLTMLELQYERLLELSEMKPKRAWVDALAAMEAAVVEGDLEDDAHRGAEYLVETFKGAA